MTQQLKGAILCAVVAVVFLALQIAFDIQTGTAGVFVMGVAGGLLVANQMTRPAPAKAARGEVVPPQPLRQHWPRLIRRHIMQVEVTLEWG